MDKTVNEAYNFFQSARIGAILGGITYNAIGGIGVAVGGTAVGITMAPMMAIGASVFAAGYGIYRVGKWMGGQGNKKSPP